MGCRYCNHGWIDLPERGSQIPCTCPEGMHILETAKDLIALPPDIRRAIRRAAERITGGKIEPKVEEWTGEDGGDPDLPF